MGEPRKQRKKYSRPTHLWRTARFEEENELQKKYGLKNKTEIWRAKAEITSVRRQAIKLQALSGVGAEKEKNDLISRLLKVGLIKSNTLEAILMLTVEDLLERRLQTIVYRKGLAQTLRQARQLITHGHIMARENVVTVPKYPVKISEEESIRLKEGSRTPPAAGPGKKEESQLEKPIEVEGVSVGQEA
ncbi:MAG: 30S ribosomal protein S4 [Candidatus Altiarchaeota archaeon]